MVPRTMRPAIENPPTQAEGNRLRGKGPQILPMYQSKYCHLLSMLQCHHLSSRLLTLIFPHTNLSHPPKWWPHHLKNSILLTAYRRVGQPPRWFRPLAQPNLLLQIPRIVLFQRWLMFLVALMHHWHWHLSCVDGKSQPGTKSSNLSITSPTHRTGKHYPLTVKLQSLLQLHTHVTLRPASEKFQESFQMAGQRQHL